MLFLFIRFIYLRTLLLFNSNATWSYQRNPSSPSSVTEAKTFTDLLLQRVPGRPKADVTLQHPQSVFQILKRHDQRYTPEMVERVCGCPPETFLKVAETLLYNSGRDKTSNITYAVGWTQHTVGVQIIRAAGMLQALLGNIGRPGGGVLALRGHSTIQGSTDIATLYHSLPGYLNMPDARKAHDTLQDFILTEGGRPLDAPSPSVDACATSSDSHTVALEPSSTHPRILHPIPP